MESGFEINCGEIVMSQIIEYIKDKKILILGYGREGISTYN